MVAKNTTDTLTNKSMSGTQNTFTNLPYTAFSAMTSAQLAGIVSDETGSGALVFANTPTLVTPVLGVATATSINKVAITAPATSATLTIANGKTLTASNTLTFTGTDGSSVAFGAGGTVEYAVTTTRGDLIRRGASANERVALGTKGFRLQSDGTDPVWANGGQSLYNAITAGYTVLDDDGYRAINATTAPSTLTFSSRSSDTVTFTAAHGMVTGTPIQFTGSGTVPTGLTNYIIYYAIVTSSTACKFATSISNALAGTAVALSGDGTGTRTWSPGIGVVLPTAADNTGRIISVGISHGSPTQMVALIPESASETIENLVGITLAFSGDRVDVYSDGTAWKMPGGFFQSYYQNVAYAVGADIATAWIAITRCGAAVSVNGIYTMDGAPTAAAQTISNILPTWARPSGNTLNLPMAISTSTGYQYRLTISTSGTVSVSALQGAITGGAITSFTTKAFSAAEDVVFTASYVRTGL